MPARHFPPPWSVEELAACFIVKDSAGHKLAFVYFGMNRVGARPPSCSHMVRRAALRRISPSSLS